MQQWQSEGLPTDEFSNENGVFITKGLRWALNIDPQSQAKIWIKNSVKDLKIADPKDKNYLKKIEDAVSNGYTILFEDIVDDTLDPSLDNILSHSYEPSAGGGSKKSYKVKFGMNEINYSLNFRLLMTTRRPNPHYTPEVSTKVAVINFTVVEAGLEE
jgi:dynein heavy chain, axonemal